MSRKQTNNAVINDPVISNIYWQTVGHFLRPFDDWLGKVEDKREQGKIKYSKQYMIWIGLMLFLCKLSTRRQMKYAFNTSAFIENINNLSGAAVDTVADHGTVNYFYSKNSSKSLIWLKNKINQQMLRNKSLENYRLLGYYLVAMDGSGHLCFGEKPNCDGCLSKTYENGVTIYYHNVVEAKLVTEFGLALSLCTEFVNNEGKSSDVQDCELAAAYRLMDTLKATHPQLKICLLMDSLYANQNILAKAEKYGWKVIINFKEGSIPTVAEEARSLIKLVPENEKIIANEKFIQEFHWVNDIDHKGFKVNHIKCIEKNGSSIKTFEWLTTFRVDNNNVDILANKGGRQRWKIENQGFNMQKNGGYNLEHPYSTHPRAIENFYHLMQIAHIINQLVEYGSLLKNIKKTLGSIRNIARRLLEELKFFKLPKLQFKYDYSYYIKLNSS